MTRTRTLLGATAGVLGAAALLHRRRSTHAPLAAGVLTAERSVAVPPGGPGPAAPVVVGQGSRAVLSPARAQAVVRAASWSETLLGLLAVVITLLLGQREEPTDPGDRAGADGPA